MRLTLLKLLPDALLVVGAALLCYGVWVVYAPAGFIVGGALTIFAGWRLA